MYKDAAGREINVGDVILHISRKGSAIYTDIGVVRKRGAENSLIWSKLDAWNLEYRRTPVEFCPETVLYRLDYCVVLPEMTEQSLVERYHIGKGETNDTNESAEDKNRYTSGRSEVSGL